MTEILIQRRRRESPCSACTAGVDADEPALFALYRLALQRRTLGCLLSTDPEKATGRATTSDKSLGCWHGPGSRRHLGTRQKDCGGIQHRLRDLGGFKSG